MTHKFLYVRLTTKSEKVVTIYLFTHTYRKYIYLYLCRYE
jgi:hypothetical protein